MVEGKEPEFFIKLQQCANGPYDDIVYEPKITGKLDYETELAIVIGKGGRHIAKRDAMKHIFGFTVMNDVTARDRQVKMRPDGTSQYALGPGKNFDTSAPLGPCIVTTDELGNPQKLALRTWVNDELRQNNTTAMMIWNVRELVHFFSGFVTLKPGSGDIDGHAGRNRVGEPIPSWAGAVPRPNAKTSSSPGAISRSAMWSPARSKASAACAPGSCYPGIRGGRPRPGASRRVIEGSSLTHSRRAVFIG